MPWLAELVEASEESLDMLPVQCLCEFLLHDPREATPSDHGDDENSRQERQRQKMVIIFLWDEDVAQLVERQAQHTADACSAPWYNKGFFSQSQFSMQILVWLSGRPHVQSHCINLQ